MQPVIKWSGSKRSQAENIKSYFPKDYNIYYEPFIGGGSMVYTVNHNKSVCSDICQPLIELYKDIQQKPNDVCLYYKQVWNELQSNGERVYYRIRERFNQEHCPEDLLFLSRTCTNGLIRFNKKGEFNNSFHHGRKGINPETLKKIIYDWSGRIKNVIFICQDYNDILNTVTDKDFVYLDPPYFNTKGMYYGQIDYKEFINFLYQLNEKHVKYALSYDGLQGNENKTVDLPKKLYVRHEYIKSGLSSFKKLHGKNEDVYESLYLNY